MWARGGQRAVEIGLAAIVHGQERGVFRIKLSPVVESALLHPAFEVVLSDFVRAIQQRVVRLKKFDWRIFIGDAREVSLLVQDFRGVWSILLLVPGEVAVVLHNESAALRDVVQQTLVGAGKLWTKFVRAHTNDDGIEF